MLKFPGIFFLFGKISEKTFELSSSYFIIRSIGLPFSLGIALFFGVFRGLQNTSWAMYIGIIGGAKVVHKLCNEVDFSHRRNKTEKNIHGRKLSQVN